VNLSPDSYVNLLASGIALTASLLGLRQVSLQKKTIVSVRSFKKI
jgi:hypothetical protein